MGSKRVDNLLLTVGAMLAVFSAIQLFLGGGLADVENILGELTSTRSVVKTKNPNSLDWRDADAGNPLGDNQLIYTDSDSSAEVGFLSGDKLSIASSALVRIRDRNGHSGLDVKKGSIRTSLTSGFPFTVGFNGKEYVMQGEKAELQISMGGDHGEIGVVSGELSLMAGDKSIRLDSTKALEITEEGIKETKIGFKLTAPYGEESIYIDSTVHLTAFDWIPDETVELHLAKSPSFEDEKVISTKSGHKENLTAGQWYWKVKTTESSSLTGNFRITQEVAPLLLRPLSGEDVSLLAPKIGSPQVLLEWKGHELWYEVEWKQKGLHSEQVNGKRLTLAASEGPLKWRVRILDKNRPKALWSEWQMVEVKIISFPDTPTDLFPHEVEFQTFKGEAQTVEMNWRSKHPVLWELDGPEGNSQKRVEQTYFSYAASKSGNYKWRVKAIDSEKREGEWSQWKSFTLTDLSDDENGEGIQRIQLIKPDQDVTFTWDSPKGSSDVFELASDAKFDDVIIKKELSNKFTKVNIPKVGTYYWRSRQYRPDGKFSVSEPVKVIIEPVSAPTKPEKAPDIEVPLEWRSKELPKSTWLDWFIPAAYAEDDLTPIVKITVPKAENAKSFVIKVYRDEDLKDLVFEQKFQGRVYEWENPIPGKYYWQYAIVDYWERSSPFSDASTLLIKDTPKLNQPKLLSPIRAVEIEATELTLNWSEAGSGADYKVEVSDDPEFKKILFTETVSGTNAKVTTDLEPKLHYWRILAKKQSAEVLSNSGRFIVKPVPPVAASETTPTEEWKKTYRSRLSFAWAPSMDTYSFEQDGEKGEIDGNVLSGLELKGILFRENFTVMGEILRQSGEVYEGESYSLQRLLLSLMWNFNSTSKLSVGLAMGQTSGQGYEIVSNVATAKSVSGMSYGPTLLYLKPWSKTWELQTKFNYLLGEIKQMDIMAEVLRHSEKFFLMGGVGMSQREYKLSSGEQSSLRISIGIGKEF